MWDRFLKWLAGKLFTWSLRMLTEKYGTDKPAPVIRRHRKPYVH